MATRIAGPLALVLSLAPTRALAHPEGTPAKTNRYLQITLLEARARLAYTILVGERPAFFLRQAADANRDGRLDASERGKLLDTLAGAVEKSLEIRLDGRSVPLRFAERDAVGDDAVAAHALGVDLFAYVEAGPGTHDLIVHDRYEPRDEGESEVTFEASPGVELRATHTGRDGSRPGGPRFAWPAPRRSDSEDRTVGARFSSGHGPARYFIGGLSVVAAAALVALGLRRKRRGRGARPDETSAA